MTADNPAALGITPTEWEAIKQMPVMDAVAVIAARTLRRRDRGLSARRGRGDVVMTADSGFKVGDPCEAIVAEFVFGPKTCGRPSVALGVDRTWGTTHVVCTEHEAGAR